MQLVTITPLRSHLSLCLGVSERSPDYLSFLSQLEKKLPLLCEKVAVSLGDRDRGVFTVQRLQSGKSYTQAHSDDRDTLCLFRHRLTWQQPWVSLDIKVFSNTMSVVVVTTELYDLQYELREMLLELAPEQADTFPIVARFSTDYFYQLADALVKLHRPEGYSPYLDEINQLLNHAELDQNGHPRLTLELLAQAKASAVVQSYYEMLLLPILKQLPNEISVRYLENMGSFTGFHDLSADDLKAKQAWSARLLRLAPDERIEYGELITSWLRQTPNPEDADAILKQQLSHSLIWLNYVLVDEDDSLPIPEQGYRPFEPEKAEYKLEAMCLAQYFYAVQDACNSNLYGAISDTYLESNTRKAEEILSGVRAITRLHISDYHENSQFLKREKKLLLEKILEGWDYDYLVSNSERLIDICSSKIDDLHSQRSENSSYYTDLILVAIGFVSLFDLAITLSEYSRTYTSSAVLGFRDEEPSGIVTAVANIETDYLFYSSAAFIILLFALYFYVKRR